MEGEKIEIFGIKYIYLPKKYKSPYFQPRIIDIKAINRPYWYINK